MFAPRRVGPLKIWMSGLLAGLLLPALVALPAAGAPGTGNGAGEPTPERPAPWAVAKGAAHESGPQGRTVPPALDRPGGADLARSADAALAPCEEDPAFLCTTVPVPLDRRHPDGRTVDIAVAVLPHTGPAAEAEGAVFVTCGGPGCSATLWPKYGFSDYVLPETAETRDLVFIDQRGVGLSDVIDCPELQAGELGELYSASRACHEQLGDTADLYATVDVADDLDDVRRALGYDRIDVFGGSYAGADMMTYAVRHSEHVRSVVLSSPAVVEGTDPFYAYAPEAMPGIVARVCSRSPACAAAHPHPARTFAALAAHLRHRPVVGVGVDSAGERHRIRVTENVLSNFIMYFDWALLAGPAEITPAARALWRGDPVPLLRLAADVDPANGFGADLRDFSNGHNLARGCVDGELPFDKEAGAHTRWRQFAAAYAAEPDRYGVISKRAWAAPGWAGWQPSPCIVARWEDRPMYRAGTTVEDVPTLVLGGEYDLPVPETVARMATEVLTDSTYVSMTGAGHDPQFWSDCGPELIQRFYRDLDVGDTSCAEQPAAAAWSPGAYVTRVRQAPPAEQVAGPAASRRERRLATVVAWTVMDSLRHNFVVPEDSVGLRGGTVDWEVVDDADQWTLDRVRFSRDVSVSGLVTLDEDGAFVADLVVRGPGRERSTARFVGPFLTRGEEVVLRTGTRPQRATFVFPAY